MDLSTRTENSDKFDGLLLTPSNELKFKGPFDDFVNVALSIQNPTDKRIAFKIKTTAPKRYCVKPNSGVLNPTEQVKVNVLLQPFQYDPSEKNKHKFMVQYVYLTEEERKMSAADILNLWKDLPGDRLLDIKLRCTFEPSESEAAATASTTGVIQNQVASTTPPAPTIVNKTTSNTNNTSSIPSQQQQPVAQVSVQQTNDAKLNSRSLRSSDSSNANANKYESLANDLKEENERLKREIDRLKDEETRLRKMALQDSSSKSHLTSSSSSQLDINQLITNKSIWIIVLLIAIIVYLAFLK